MSELEDFIKKDKAGRKKLEAAVKEAIEFVEAHGYEVFTKGTLDEEKKRTRSWMKSSASKGGDRIMKW